MDTDSDSDFHPTDWRDADAASGGPFFIHGPNNTRKACILAHAEKTSFSGAFTYSTEHLGLNAEQDDFQPTIEEEISFHDVLQNKDLKRKK